MENTKTYERLFFEKKQDNNDIESIDALFYSIRAMSIGKKSSLDLEIHPRHNLDQFLYGIAKYNVISPLSHLMVHAWESGSQLILNCYDTIDKRLSTRLVAPHGGFNADLVNSLQRFYKSDGNYDLFNHHKK